MEKNVVGRQTIYSIPQEVEGIRFKILLSQNQLRKIARQNRSVVRVDIELISIGGVRF